MFIVLTINFTFFVLKAKDLFDNCFAEVVFNTVFVFPKCVFYS